MARNYLKQPYCKKCLGKVGRFGKCKRCGSKKKITKNYNKW